MFLLHYFLVTELKEFWCVPDITAQASVLHNRVQSRVHSGAAPLPLHMPHFNLFLPEDEHGSFLFVVIVVSSFSFYCK